MPSQLHSLQCFLIEAAGSAMQEEAGAALAAVRMMILVAVMAGMGTGDCGT